MPQIAMTAPVGRLRRRGLAVAALMVLASLFGGGRADAQNLVQDPGFTNGFNAYIDVCCNVTTMPGDGFNIAVLPGGSTFGQIIPTSLDSQYLISFFASFSGPGSYLASFGNRTFTEDPTTPGLFSFTATGTGNNTLLYFSTGTGSNIEYLSNLDVEPASAPAPIAGSGLLSFCALLGAAVLHRLRRTGRQPSA